MATVKESRATEVKTPEFRVAFPSVFKVKKNNLSGDEKFELVALFNKDTTDMAPIKKAMNEAIKKKWADKNSIPKNLRNPIRDGDEKKLEGFENHWYITLKSDYQPDVVGTRKVKNEEGELVFVKVPELEFYGGCYARAVINAFAYSNKGNSGVSFGLGNIQKTREGDKFGGGSVASEDAFADTPEVAEDEADNSTDDWG